MRLRIKNSGPNSLVFIGALFFFSGVTSVLATGAPPPVNATPQMIEDAASLMAREKTVAVQEKENERRKRQLDRLEKEVEQKLTKLTALQDDIQKKLDYIKSLNVRDKEFRNLIKVYSAMSATKLAPLLDEMKDDNVAKILRAMKAEEVAKILPKLGKDKAVRVSRLLGMID